MAITNAPIHATLAVSDLDKAKAWYADRLGWEPFREVPGTLIYRVGDSFFTLFTTPNARTAKNTVINWNVDDLQAEVDRLKANGVAFEDYDFGDFKTEDGILSDPVGGKTAWFKDLDGNIIGVLQAPPGQGSSHSISVMLAASDLGRAKAWYSEKLGFEPVAEFSGMVMDYVSADTSFNVYKTDFAGSAKNTVAIWRTKDLLAEVANLRQRGLTFEEYPPDEGERYVDGVLFFEDKPVNAWFTDSEGNILALAEDQGGFAE
jgi:catechol 2,3-dioxygenase-like lactoylglutathione lyase family enzyme